MKKYALSILIATCSSVVFAEESVFVRYYVSPGGDDANPGTPEKPFASPLAARNAVRRLLAEPGASPAAVVVEFADGTYCLDRAFKLDERDAAPADCPIIYRAAHVGNAVFTGAVELEWKPIAKGDPRYESIPEASREHVLVARVPGTVQLPDFKEQFKDHPEKGVDGKQLSVYAGGKRLNVASWPDGAGWARLVDAPGPKVGAGWLHPTGVVRLRADADGSAPNLVAWAKEEGLYVDAMWNFGWRHSCVPIRQVDAKGDWIVLDPDGTRDSFVRGAYARVKNAFCELDRPGEWVLDFGSGHCDPPRRVYVWPPKDEMPELALTPGLIEIDGAHGTVFEGFVFQYSRDTHIVVRRSRDVTIRTSKICHGAKWGIEVEGGVNCRVEGCDLFDLGAGGVKVVGGNQETLSPAGHIVDNCHIQDFSKTVFYYRPGVYAGGVGCRITHNLIHHARHTAIGFGGNDHYIGYNVIHDVCQETADAGAIYVYSDENAYASRGTVVEYNVLHAIGRPHRTSETEAIYFDGFSTGMTARGNIINRASTGIFLQGGHDYLAERNVIINCSTSIDRRNLGKSDNGWSPHPWTKSFDESPLLQPLVRNRSLYMSEYWQRRYPTVLRALKIAEEGDTLLAQSTLYTTIASNVIVSSGIVAIADPKNTNPTVVDNMTMEGDPGFVDYMGMNWELREDSSARKVLGGGTRFGAMGLYPSPLRYSPAVKFGEGVTAPRKIARERRSAVTRTAVVFEGELPDEKTPFADSLERCALGPGNWGVRNRTIIGLAFGCEYLWHKGKRLHEFSFTPRFSGKARLILWGEWGEKTMYSDIHVSGAELASEWRQDTWCPCYTMGNADTRPFSPCGLVGDELAANANETCVSDLILAKDVPVTIRFASRTDTQSE